MCVMMEGHSLLVGGRGLAAGSIMWFKMNVCQNLTAKPRVPTSVSHGYGGIHS